MYVIKKDSNIEQKNVVRIKLEDSNIEQKARRENRTQVYIGRTGRTWFLNAINIVNLIW